MMVMMMMVMMMMLCLSWLRFRAKPRHLPYIYIYIYTHNIITVYMCTWKPNDPSLGWWIHSSWAKTRNLKKTMSFGFQVYIFIIYLKNILYWTTWPSAVSRFEPLWQTKHSKLFTIKMHTDPRFAQARNSVNTTEFCATSNDGKDFIFNYVARVLTRTCCFYISYNKNMSLLHIIWNQPYSH